MSKKDLWKKLSELFNGKFQIKQTISKDINSFQLEIPFAILECQEIVLQGFLACRLYRG